MDHPKYHQFLEDFLNSYDWQYLSSSDEADDEDYLDGLLTPVSINSPPHAPSAYPIHDSSPKGGNRESSVSDLRQKIFPSSSPRRPITRSYGNDCVSLDYRRKGFVVCRPAMKNISMTFEGYLRQISSEQTEATEQVNRRVYPLLDEDPHLRLDDALTTFAEGRK